MKTGQSMTATMGDSCHNGRNLSGIKERINELALVVYTGADDPASEDGFRAPVRVSWYMGRSRQASVVYCSVWISGRDRGGYWAGHGNAGGYGYHKQSAAFQDALGSAGVGLSTRIHGAGDSAVREAMHAIADAIGYAGIPRTIV